MDAFDPQFLINVWRATTYLDTEKLQNASIEDIPVLLFREASERLQSAVNGMSELAGQVEQLKDHVNSTANDINTLQSLATEAAQEVDAAIAIVSAAEARVKAGKEIVQWNELMQELLKPITHTDLPSALNEPFVRAVEEAIARRDQALQLAGSPPPNTQVPARELEQLQASVGTLTQHAGKLVAGLWRGANGASLTLISSGQLSARAYACAPNQDHLLGILSEARAHGIKLRQKQDAPDHGVLDALLRRRGCTDREHGLPRVDRGTLAVLAHIDSLGRVLCEEHADVECLCGQAATQVVTEAVQRSASDLVSQRLVALPSFSLGLQVFVLLRTARDVLVERLPFPVPPALDECLDKLEANLCERALQWLLTRQGTALVAVLNQSALPPTNPLHAPLPAKLAESLRDNFQQVISAHVQRLLKTGQPAAAVTDLIAIRDACRGAEGDGDGAALLRSQLDYVQQLLTGTLRACGFSDLLKCLGAQLDSSAVQLVLMLRRVRLHTGGPQAPSFAMHIRSLTGERVAAEMASLQKQLEVVDVGMQLTEKEKSGEADDEQALRHIALFQALEASQADVAGALSALSQPQNPPEQ